MYPSLRVPTVECNEKDKGNDGGQARAMRAMATMWAAAAEAAAMAAVAAALLMMFPVSLFLFSILLQRSSENNTV